MRHLKGSQLSAIDQQIVLASYVHRFTRHHVPTWAKKPRPDGSAYPVQFDNDTEWLANTLFAVTQAGRLDQHAKSCMSSPTWPTIPN